MKTKTIIADTAAEASAKYLAWKGNRGTSCMLGNWQGNIIAWNGTIVKGTELSVTAEVIYKP